MTQIGISVSTHNRPEHLELCLRHLVAYEPATKYARLTVCDDGSTPENSRLNKAVCERWGATFIASDVCRGVAATKNSCLRSVYGLEACFLFDDDCFPDAEDWVDTFVAAHHSSGAHHLSYTPWQPAARVRTGSVYAHPWGMGCCLFFTAPLLASVGGFDEKYKTFGYEHMAYARRAHRAGFNAGLGAYLTPVEAIGRMYALDYEFTVQRQQPSLGTIQFPHVRTVVSERLGASSKANKVLFENDNDDLYIPLCTEAIK
ncbi:MAG: glycosyltransferase [Armatimonadetes bacterium]|nr:glycosyltransferase [Armatimonadota bacterium]